MLIACEFSGRVRDAFIERGHSAVSCDLVSSLTLGLHYKGDVRDILGEKWDLMIAHPPCTNLTIAGNNNWNTMEAWELQQRDLEFVETLLGANIPKICVENPPGLISTMIRKPDQYVHPYWFGEPYTKRTGLWLKGLPLLRPTNNLWHKPDEYPILRSWVSDVTRNAAYRSWTFKGLAEAMAEQWGRE